jgi:DNA-binding SARP family transcriptional activator
MDPSGDVRIEPGNCTWIDLVEFQHVFQGIPANPAHISNCQIASIEKAVDLYRGDLLPEFDVEWARKVRDHARQCYLEMLQILIDRFTTDSLFDKLATYADRYLRVDPYVEQVHVALIRAYLASGRRSLAAASAEACQRIFAEDLGVALGPEAERVMKPLLTPHRPAARRMRFAGQERTRIDRVDELRDTLSQLLVTCAALLDELQSPGARRQ